MKEIFDEALELIDRSGLAPALQTLADCNTAGQRRVGRPRKIPKVRGLLAAFMVNGATPHHRGSLIDIQRLLHAADPDLLKDLELPYSEKDTYDHLQRFLTWLATTLKAAPQVDINGETVQLDAFEFMNRLLDASVQTTIPHPEFRSIAADDTSVETWAALYGDPAVAKIVHDDDNSGYGDAPKTKAPAKGSSSQLQVRGVDAKGRNIYTIDPDARASYATATNSRSGHKFVGYHLFLAVSTKSICKTDGREELTFGPPVPELILGAQFAPGGDHRGEALVRILEHVHDRYPKINEVICDAGFTKAKPHRFFHPTRKLGFDVMFEPKNHQRGTRPFAGDALCLDGGLFSPLLPPELQGVDQHGNSKPLRFAHWRESSQARRAAEKAFNERAKYAYRRHNRPDADGAMRFKCPFHGYLRAPQVPQSMRAGHHVALVNLPDSTGACCTNGSGVISVSADDAIWWQPIPFGTTAWRRAYGRKNTAEKTNAGLKGQYIDLTGKYIQVVGLEKMTIFLAFALAGYNLDRLHEWERKTTQQAATKTRSKRREGTWHRDTAA